MPIIFSPYPPDKIKKISEAIEKKIKQAKSEIVALLGICLLGISLTAFLLSSNNIAGIGRVRGYELVVQYRLVTARIFALLHFLGLLILATPKFPDKFRYATPDACGCNGDRGISRELILAVGRKTLEKKSIGNKEELWATWFLFSE